MAKQVFTFRLGKNPAILVASLSAKLLELEKDHGFKFDPTGLKWDGFGKSFVSSHYEDWQIYDLPKLRKYIAWSEKVGAPLIY